MIKLPRTPKGQFSSQIVTKELWKEFIKDFPEYSKIDYKTFQSKWEDIAETIRNESITNPLGVKLGSYTGELKYQYLPYNFKAIDNKTSNDLGKKIEHLNLVTKGKVGKIKWERRWASKFNKVLQFFAYEPDRRMVILSKQHTDKNPNSIRVSRNTLKGNSIWRQIKKK